MSPKSAKNESPKHREKADRKRRRALEAFGRLQRAAALTSTAADAALAPFGLSASQLGVLETLQARGPLHQQELARTLGRSKAQVTAIIDALEKRALASRERHATDRRFTTVHLTGAGAALLVEALPVRAEAVLASMSALSGDQKSRLARLSRRLIKALAPEEAERDESEGSGESDDAEESDNEGGAGADASREAYDARSAVTVTLE